MTATRAARRAPTSAALLVAVALAGAACNQPNTSSAHSPSPVAATSPTASGGTPQPSRSSTPSPISATTPYGVLAGPFTGTNYNVSIVDVNGKVVATAQSSTPVSPTCANTAAGVVPATAVSTSNSRAYYMDADGALRWVAPDGSKSSAAVTSLPIGPSTRSVFAVSPDDTEIAVSVIDFTQGGATTRLYVDELKEGGAQGQIFHESGSLTVWPLGWHAGNLVVGKVPACTQGGGPLCCGPQEIHVVDPVTALRKATLGGPSCVPAGPPSAAGVVCEDTALFTTATALDWTGATLHTFKIDGPTPAYLDPSGSEMALVTSTDTTVFPSPLPPFAGLQSCEWLDFTHLLAGGDAQTQPRIANVGNGVVTAISAQGRCAGRIPGAL